jgi:GDP/UDP-N,N'-diacetylbacillosamine 2-epimerase (hydrolysing)
MAKGRRIAVVTGSRSDYGLLYWTLRGIHHDPDLEAVLLVTSMHLSPEFGLTVREIEKDGFPIAARVETLLSSDTGEAVATSIGVGIIRMAQELSRLKPDLLVVLGDRPEILAAAAAALPLSIPVAHIHGGESSEGAIDEGIRHAVTKLSHLHFASTEFYARRLLQMGEEEWRVHVCGAPGLEHLHRAPLPSRSEVESVVGIDLGEPTLLATQHPATMLPDNGASDTEELLSALEDSGLPVVITYPNADKGGRAIIQQVEALRARLPRVQARANLGNRMYLGLLSYAAALVGNSSSGIIEAASLRVPVVNVGARQQGRLRPGNVIDVPGERGAILAGIRRALDPSFRQMVGGLSNPYDRGKASEIILRVIKEVELGQRLLQKRLVDLPSTLAGLPEAARV